MSRIRTLKPSILEDEKVAPLSDSAFRLFTSMIVLADDYGNVRADLGYLRGQIWHSRESPNVLQLLVELHRAPLIYVYAVRGGTYAHLLGWEKHQRIDNAGRARVPAPNETGVTEWSAGQGFAATAAGQGFAAPTNGDSSAGHRLAESLRESPRVSAKFGSDLDQEGDQEGECARDRAPPKPSGKRTRIPDGWQPSSAGLDRAHALELDAVRETEKFRQHYVSTGQRFVDWNAAFLKWLERGREFADERKKPGQPAREIREL